MVYRNENGSIITGFQKEACEFAYNDACAKLGGSPYADDYEFAIEWWDDPDVGAHEYDSFEWQDVLNYPEQHVERLYGWDWSRRNTWDREPREGTVRRMACIMADGSVYNSYDNGIFWMYAFSIENDSTVVDYGAPQKLLRALVHDVSAPGGELWDTYVKLDFFIRA